MKAVARGFTLIELVVSIVIASILLAFMGIFVAGPLEIYLSQTRRAALIDSTDAGWKQIDDEIRRALPNSVRRSRNGSFEALEVLQTIDVARYRDAPGAGNPGDLDFGIPVNGFTTAGRFRNFGDGFVSPNVYLVVNSTPASNAYSGANVITPMGTQISFANSAANPGELDVSFDAPVTLNPPATLPSPPGSPQHRIFLVSGAVSYLCNEAAGTLTRYTNYGINAAQIDTPAGFAGAGATATPVATNLLTCSFSVSPGTALHGEVASLRFTFAPAGDPLAEQMTVMRQSHVEYLP